MQQTNNHRVGNSYRSPRDDLDLSVRPHRHGNDNEGACLWSIMLYRMLQDGSAGSGVNIMNNNSTQQLWLECGPGYHPKSHELDLGYIPHPTYYKNAPAHVV